MRAAPTIVFIGKGRLGNQLFQWATLRKHFPGSSILAPSLAAIPQVIDTGDTLKVTLSPGWLDRLLRRKFGRLVMRSLFKHLRLGGYAHEPFERLPNGSDLFSGRLEVRSGTRPVVFVDGGYFQNLDSLLQPADFQGLHLRPALLQQARAAVAAAVAESASGGAWPQAVMHVRRADFLHYRPFGLADVSLPTAYYERAAAALRERVGANAPLLIVTDDAAWCRQALAALQPFCVVSNSEAVDFATLALFPAVAVSNSTFSLAAAFISREVQQVVAPEFWFGARVGRWHPPQMRCNDPRVTYL